MQDFLKTWGMLLGWTLTTVMQVLLAIAHWKESRDRADFEIIASADKDSAVWTQKFKSLEDRVAVVEHENRHVRQRLHELNEMLQKATLISDQLLRERERYERLVETQSKRLDDLYREIKRFNGRVNGGH